MITPAIFVIRRTLSTEQVLQMLSAVSTHPKTGGPILSDNWIYMPPAG